MAEHFDYDLERSAFSWAREAERLPRLPAGGLNIAHVALDARVEAGYGDDVALVCVPETGPVTRHTYADLSRETSRFAHLLRRLGIGCGDRVMSLLGRQAEQYVTALGTLKNGSVFSPLFASFGPEPIRQRLLLGDAKVLVTTPSLYRRKVAPIRAELPALEHVLLVGAATLEDTLDLEVELAGQPTDFDIPPTDPEQMALLHFTSGTTGTPKGAVHVHQAVLAHHVSARYALDLHHGDVFWCTADPGWVTGTSYGIIAPLTHGVTIVTYAGEYDPRVWYAVLAEHRVNVWYTAPTALRMLMRSGAELPREYDLSALRHIASVGEALNPEVVRWGEQAYGMPIHDNWWQTETGAIMVSNYRGTEVRPGSMGRPMPGIDAVVLRRGADGRADRTGGRVTPAEVGEVGELALREGWPSMFRGYLDQEQRYRSCFVDGFYLSGDLAKVDADGYVWFVGRADDVIKSAGHLVGPFEVETALMEHPAVVEAGVIGKPDELAGEVVKAFVTLRAGYDPTEQLRGELLAFGRKRLGGLAPKEIAFDQHLPHTRSGKVMRRLLKARELGLPEGDVSTLEGQP